MRLRKDHQQGTLSAPASLGATSLSSASFATLPEVVAPHVLVVTLDTAGVAGNPDTVTVTAHAPGATTVTTTATARAHAAGIGWKHGPVASDFGQVVFRTVTGLLQEAIDNADAAGGGIVPLDSGTHTASALVLKDGVELRGSGYGATTLKLANGANTFLLETEGFAGLTGGVTSGGAKRFGIRDMTIDGNKANVSATVPLVRLYGYDYRLDGLRILDSDDVGLWAEWGSDAADPGPSGMEANVHDVKVLRSDSHGVVWKGPHDSKWDKFIAIENGDRGFWILPNGGALVAHACHSWGLSQSEPWYVETEVRATNCTAEGGSGDAQIVVAGQDFQWTGGIVMQGAGGGITPTAIGIQLGTGGQGVTDARINTVVLNCSDGAINYVNDSGGNVVDITAWCPNDADLVRAGTRNAGTAERIMRTGTSGLAGQMSDTIIPSPLAVGGNLGVFGGDVVIQDAGKGIRIKSGANARAGISQLSGGTLTINNNTITSNTLIFAFPLFPSGAVSALAVTARSLGTSFTVTSANGSDASFFSWLLVEQI